MARKKQTRKRISLLTLLICIFICEAAGGVSSLFLQSKIPLFYQSLQKPSFSPPPFVFAPVWTLLYLLLGISLYRIWTIKKEKKNEAIIIFFISLLLNAIWTPIFFGLQNLLVAFIEIVILWFSITAVINRFNYLDKKAAYLLIPYLLWVSFAAVLNFAILVLN